MLWSNIESAIGLIACSMPDLRKLLIQKTQKSAPCSGPISLVTIGGGGGVPAPRGKAFRASADQGISFVAAHTPANRDWTRLQDSDTDVTTILNLGKGGMQ